MERKVESVLRGERVTEGAGVRLKRIFGYYEAGMLDPFLLFDDFCSDNPDDYKRGFPWHPHRGIETITYVLRGDVEHADSLGNKGIISGGDMQWMTAGSGIIHQEMPKGDSAGSMHGFQLWANLPAEQKMTAPKYRDLRYSKIPEARLANGISAKVIAGTFEGVKGPVDDIVIRPCYFDISMPAETSFAYAADPGDTVFIYVIQGRGQAANASVEDRMLALFTEGDMAKFRTEASCWRFLLVSGSPLKEPIAWRGPIVMNTQDELDLAFKEFSDGSFIK